MILASCLLVLSVNEVVGCAAVEGQPNMWSAWHTKETDAPNVFGIVH